MQSIYLYIEIFIHIYVNMYMCNNTNTAFWSGAGKDENYASGSFACNPYARGNGKKVGRGNGGGKEREREKTMISIHHLLNNIPI